MRVPFKPEVTSIPVTGVGAHVGAMAYFAVLAYPNRDGWSKRDKLVDALKAWLSKAYIAKGGDRRKILRKYKRLKNEAIEGTLSLAFYRIQALRLPAARMAYWKLIHGQIVGSVVKGTRSTVLRLRAPKESEWANKFAEEYPSWEPTSLNECARLMAFELENARRAWGWHDHKDAAPLSQNPDITIESASKNVLKRVWKATMPVLHLAMAFPKKQEHPDILGLIHDPSWLPSTLRYAEGLRRMLPQFIHRYDSEKAIRLLPITYDAGDTLRRRVAIDKSKAKTRKRER